MSEKLWVSPGNVKGRPQIARFGDKLGGTCVSCGEEPSWTLNISFNESTEQALCPECEGHLLSIWLLSYLRLKKRKKVDFEGFKGDIPENEAVLTGGTFAED